MLQQARSSGWPALHVPSPPLPPPPAAAAALSIATAMPKTRRAWRETAASSQSSNPGPTTPRAPAAASTCKRHAWRGMPPLLPAPPPLLLALPGAAPLGAALLAALHTRPPGLPTRACRRSAAPRRRRPMARSSSNATAWWTRASAARAAHRSSPSPPCTRRGLPAAAPAAAAPPAGAGLLVPGCRCPGCRCELPLNASPSPVPLSFLCPASDPHLHLLGALS